MALSYLPENVGEFQEATQRHWFTYRPTENPWAIAQGLPFEVDCGHGEVRFANVLKTVLWLATDEDASGAAVLEKWNIRHHTTYPARLH